MALMGMLAALACQPRKDVESSTPPVVVDADPTPAGEGKHDAPAPSFEYPKAARGDVVDEYHGVKVADPYRWLEDLDGERTRAWVEAENAVTFRYLETIAEREAIRERLTALWNYERWGVPSRHGDRYVVSRNDGLQNQSVLYTLDRLDGEPTLLLDPNTLAKDGTVALSGTNFSQSGTLMAYGTSASGSDWEVWKVRDVATAQDRPDELRWIKFSDVAWTRGDEGFYYARYDAPKAGDELEDLNYDQKVYYHRVGTTQDQDVLVYARPDHKDWGFTPTVTEDGQYLVLTVRIGTDPRKSIFFQKIPNGGRGPSKGVAKGPAKTMKELLPDFRASYAFIGNDGPVFYFRTDDGAPKGRIVAVDTRKPVGKNQRELVGEAADTLRSASLVGDSLFLGYLKDAHSKVEIFDLKGKRTGEVELPGLGSAGGFGGKRSHTETFYSFSSFATPGTIHRFDLRSKKSEVFREPKVAFSPGDYVTEQVFYASKDGTRIPMFLSRRKDLKPSADTPTYLYGYGGFDIAITPSFSVPNLVWMEMGGLYAVANLRGGGEYGEDWHQAGTKLDKQNVFDDFIAAAEYLVAQGWTSPAKLAIGGRSNGGLLVGAVMTQRPDLFGAALPGVGVMDMLRFNQFTIGWAWESDYGSPADPEQFKALRSYSPYHNLKEGTAYPATLVYTADHDDRVVPGHSYKFAAQLQHAHAGKTPVLIRIDTKSGHGAGKPTAKQIEEWADLWGFVVDNLDMTPMGGS
ncbi:prolyl oligopeptidase family serine peptidase [Paraliomyxa miuraensis]|uniref:prolyl oligopeptidase family serine peptidase n=1 Tax=Paraliomyxa miuraensis TaxID=376150 RepID=UPI00224D2A1D|nr:prolyl oligopeptidase family serine peptidase [Paraliomyxa miuraensis]